jgi:hypothetical protein
MAMRRPRRLVLRPGFQAGRDAVMSAALMIARR